MENYLQRREEALAKTAKKFNLPFYEFTWDEDGILRFKNSGFPVPNVEIIPKDGKENKFKDPNYHYFRNGIGQSSSTSGK
ncbi:MAG: hypothetical protein WCW93_01610 [Candidatus Paceibacterota bacterium]